MKSMDKIAIAFAAGVIAVLMLAAGAADAQSTATPTLPGSLTNTGCAPGVTYCWTAYSSANPLPVTPGTGFLGNMNLSQVGGSAVVTGGVNGSLGTGGLAANGAAVAGNPNLIAGSDGTDARTVTTDASGHVVVVGTGTFATQSTLQAGSAIAGKFGIDQTTPGTTNGVQTLSGSTTAVTQATASNLNAQAVGNVAANAADSGNPVEIGCNFNSTLPSITTGNRSIVQCTTKGEVLIGMSQALGATGAAIAGGMHDNVSNLRPLGVGDYLYNGSTEDGAFTCASTANVSVTAGNTTQIVALSGSTVIRVCSVSLGISATGTVNVVTGTGTNCATPTTISNAIPLATGQMWQQTAPAGGSLFRSTAGGEICIAAGTGNVTGFISYAQY